MRRGRRGEKIATLDGETFAWRRWKKAGRATHLKSSSTTTVAGPKTPPRLPERTTVSPTSVAIPSIWGSFDFSSPPAVSPVSNFLNPFSFSNKSQLSAHDPEPSAVFSLFASTLSGNQPKVFTLGRTAKKPCRSYPNEPITVFTLGRTAKKPPQSCPNEPITVFSLGRAAKKVTQCDSHIQAGSRVNQLINLFEFGKSYPPSPFRFGISPKNDG